MGGPKPGARSSKSRLRAAFVFLRHRGAAHKKKSRPGEVGLGWRRGQSIGSAQVLLEQAQDALGHGIGLLLTLGVLDRDH